MRNTTYTKTKIYRLRQSLGWTQQQMADHFAVTRALVAHWESGIRTPSGPVLILLRQLENQNNSVKAC